MLALMGRDPVVFRLSPSTALTRKGDQSLPVRLGSSVQIVPCRLPDAAHRVIRNILQRVAQRIVGEHPQR
jgi:hypothetical protein